MIAEHISLSLRAPEPEDATLLYMWENDPQVWRVSLNSEPLSLMAIREYICGIGSANIYATRQMRLMIDRVDIDGDTLDTVGTVDLTDFDPRNARAQVGIFIAERYRHEGYALEALRLMAEYAENVLSLKQLWSIVAANNTASKALFRRAGYVRRATLPNWVRRGSTWVDAYLYCLPITT